jgi:hypothetical protein
MLYMYLREVVSKRKKGPDSVYVQLVEGKRDPRTSKVKTTILHTFGRKDQLDLEQIKRLVNQLIQYLDGGERPELLSGVEIASTWDLGGTSLLDGIWRELGLDRFFAKALAERSFGRPVERALFSLVAQRALAPGSKLAGSRWAGGRAWIPGLEEGGEELSVHHLYRAMDFLDQAMPELREHLYFQVTDLLNADVSVLFYDTTTVSFYLDGPDPEGGLRQRGHSKKKRPDLPQIVMALAINREGLPVRHWVFPGNRADVSTVEEVVRDLAGLRPRRFLFVGDRGLVSQGNVDWLESRRLSYLLGCRLRSEGTVDKVALSIRGRYHEVRPGLGVKETTVTEGSRTVRYLLCRDEARADHDARVRREILATLEQELSGPRRGEGHRKKDCKLLSQPGYARYLREGKDGRLSVARGKVRAEERLDGKYVLVTNELELPVEELVLGYRQMYLAERAFRTMKSVLEIEPVYHRTEGRITAHVHLCVLAYLLMRVAENRTGESWELLREQLGRVSLAELATDRARVLKTKRLTASEADIFKSCRVSPPARIVSIR